VSWLPAVAIVLIFTALLGWTQFSFDTLLDSDSYFHSRAARELNQHGIQREFPQTVYSTWSDRYSDKDLLFHVLLIPFQQLHLWGVEGAAADDGSEDLVTPGKQAVVFFDLLFFAAFACSLRLLGVRYFWFWMILYFVADAPLIYRWLLLRPGLLGVTFVTLEVALVLGKKYRWLAVVGVLHTLSHSSFVLLPAIAVAATSAHLLRREPVPFRLLAAAVAGPLVANIFNPFFPNNLFLVWDQIVEVARGVWLGRTEIPAYLFGTELVATKTNLFLWSFPAFLPAACGTVAFLAFPRRNLSTRGLSLMLISGLLLSFAFLSERFLAFFFPVVVLLGALLWTELLEDVSFPALRRQNPRAFFAVIGLLVVCLGAGMSDGSVFSLRAQVRTRAVEPLRPAVEFLRKQARPEELVYHNFWWDFSILYHYRPQGRYIVALDPVFFYRHDPELFGKSLAAFHGQTPNLYRVLKEDFGAEWIFLPKREDYFPFFNLMREDERFQWAYEDEAAFIARLK